MCDPYKTLLVYAASLLPVMEGRYAIVLGAGLGLPPHCYLAAAVMGVATLSILLPLLLGWADRLATRLASTSIPLLSRLARAYTRYREGARSRAARLVNRYGLPGLIFFVAVPLPATGIWTGAIGSFLLGMERRRMALGLLSGGLLSVALVYAHLGLLSG